MPLKNRYRVNLISKTVLARQLPFNHFPQIYYLLLAASLSLSLSLSLDLLAFQKIFDLSKIEETVVYMRGVQWRGGGEKRFVYDHFHTTTYFSSCHLSLSLSLSLSLYLSLSLVVKIQRYRMDRRKKPTPDMLIQRVPSKKILQVDESQKKTCNVLIIYKSVRMRQKYLMYKNQDHMGFQRFL